MYGLAGDVKAMHFLQFFNLLWVNPLTRCNLCGGIGVDQALIPPCPDSSSVSSSVLKKQSSSMSPCTFLATIHPRSSMETMIFIAYRL